MKKVLLSFFFIPILFSCNNMQTTKKVEWDSARDTVFRTTLFECGMKEGVNCYRIPAIVTAPNGDLIVVADERVPDCQDLLWNDNINLVMRRSNDGGHTWTPVETVVDFPVGESASDPSMVVDEKTNEIFLFYNYRDLKKENTGNRLHFITSKDNGKTWSEYKDITNSIIQPGTELQYNFISSGRGLYTTDGRILHTIVNPDISLNEGMSLFESCDDGRTWHAVGGYIVPGNESKVLELSDGRIMINSRVDGSGVRYVHVSDDQGKSWKTYPDSALVDPGCNGSIITYSAKKDKDDKNRVLISHAGDPKGRKNLTVRLSYDDATTWAYSKTLYPGSTAYSSMTVLKNGDIADFYEKDSRAIEVAVFSLGWLTNGEDTYKKVSR